MAPKERKRLYLGAATLLALEEYQRRHAARFGNVSQAAEHLLQRALAGALDEGLEGLLLPAIERAVRAAVREEVAATVEPRLERQSHRLAGLLVASGKDAHRAASLAAAALEAQVGPGAAAIARDAELAAGARYSRPGLRAAGD